MRRYVVRVGPRKMGFQDFDTLIAAIFCGLMLNATMGLDWGIYDSFQKGWVNPPEYMKPFVV